MAAVGWRNLSLADAKVVAPYAVAFAAIPTLAAAGGREHYPPWPVLPLSTTTLLSHFTFVRAKLPARWWSLLSSAFTHLDANHRDSNLLSLLFSALPLARRLGSRGMAAVFLGGHIAAALNTRGRVLQLERYVDRSTGRLAPSWLSAGVAKLFNTASPQAALGGSAGVFALFGFDLCLGVRSGLDLLRRGASEEQVVGEGLRLLLGLLPVVSMVLSEHRSLEAGESLSVAHAAHLTGFAWGVACCVASALFGGGEETRQRGVGAAPARGRFGTGVAGRRLGRE